MNIILRLLFIWPLINQLKIQCLKLMNILLIILMVQ
jgi:hypothetical protein